MNKRHDNKGFGVCIGDLCPLKVKHANKVKMLKQDDIIYMIQEIEEILKAIK
jgi:hypothetical protein